MITNNFYIGIPSFTTSVTTGVRLSAITSELHG